MLPIGELSSLTATELQPLVGARMSWVNNDSGHSIASYFCGAAAALHSSESGGGKGVERKLDGVLQQHYISKHAYGCLWEEALPVGGGDRGIWPACGGI